MVFRHHRYGILLVLVLLLSLPSAAIWDLLWPDNTPIRIGLAVNLSGQGGTAGEYVREGALFAVDEVNAAGGINGRPLELLVVDDRNTREGIAEADKKLLQAGVLAIIGHVTSNSSLIAYPAVTSVGVLMLSPYTATRELSGVDDLFFRTSVDTVQYAGSLNKLLAREKAQSVAFLMDMSNPSFVTEYAELTSQGYPGRTKQIRFDPEKGIAWEKVIAEIQDFAPDVVVLLTEVSKTGIAAQKLRLNGYRGALVATLWAQTDDLMRFGGTAVEGLSLITFLDPGWSQPDYLAVSRKMQSRIGRPLNARSARAYEAVSILKQALLLAQRPTVEELKRQLLSHEFHTLLGTVKFDRYGDVSREIYEVKVDHGRFVKASTLQ